MKTHLLPVPQLHLRTNLVAGANFSACEQSVARLREQLNNQCYNWPKHKKNNRGFNMETEMKPWQAADV
jgi:hypothetical protein